jgi:hypothetical protein
MSNHDVAGIGFKVTDTLKLPHMAKCGFVEVEAKNVRCRNKTWVLL